MTPIRLRVRLGLLAVLTLIAATFVAQSGRAQPNFRGNSPGMPLMPPGPGFSGNPSGISGGITGNPTGFSGGITGNPTGISGGFSGNFSGISGGFSGISGGRIEIPTIVTVWSCRRCGREVSRGNFPPQGPCPHCNNTGNVNNPGGWNNPPSTPPYVPPPQNQPIYPPSVPQNNNPQPSRDNRDAGGIQSSPGGFFSSAPQNVEPTEPSTSNGGASLPIPQVGTAEVPASKSNSRTVIVVVVVLLLLLGVAAGVLILINHSRKKRYEYRPTPRRRRAEPAAPPRRRYRDD